MCLLRDDCAPLSGLISVHQPDTPNEKLYNFVLTANKPSLRLGRTLFLRHFQGPLKGSVLQHRLPLSLLTEDGMDLKSGAD